jgi:hypothetical protein
VIVPAAWNADCRRSQVRANFWNPTADVDGRAVYVVGYPGSDGRRSEPEPLRRIFMDVYNVKRLQPGRAVKYSPRFSALEHDCSTLGGNSALPVRRRVRTVVWQRQSSCRAVALTSSRQPCWLHHARDRPHDTFGAPHETDDGAPIEGLYRAFGQLVARSDRGPVASSDLPGATRRSVPGAIPDPGRAADRGHGSPRPSSPVTRAWPPRRSRPQDVSSSNFPRFDRNTNTGGTIASAAQNSVSTASLTVRRFDDRHRSPDRALRVRERLRSSLSQRHALHGLWSLVCERAGSRLRRLR